MEKSIDPILSHLNPILIIIIMMIIEVQSNDVITMVSAFHLSVGTLHNSSIVGANFTRPFQLIASGAKFIITIFCPYSGVS